MKFEKGWLRKTIKEAKKEYDKWPDWKKEAMKLTEEEYDLERIYKDQTR